MVADIGRSTDPSTATHRADVPGSEAASFRYNNPGAQYPSARAARFGQTGFGIIGGGHKIARFPSPVNGAAANFDLLSSNYAGMPMGAAGKKWTGSYGFGIPGYPDERILTKEMLDDPTLAIAILKAIAGREVWAWQQPERRAVATGAPDVQGGQRRCLSRRRKVRTERRNRGRRNSRPHGSRVAAAGPGAYRREVRQRACAKRRPELERAMGLRRVHVVVGVPGGAHPLWL